MKKPQRQRTLANPAARLRFATGVVCHTGNARSRNEDAYACPGPCAAPAERGTVYELQSGASGAVFLVADGVGGSDEGQAASLIAARALIEGYYGLPVTGDAARLLEAAVTAANQKVYEFAVEADATASTTLTALLYLGARGIIAHVGDSRLYRVRAGAIEPLTQDHQLLSELVRSGRVEAEDAGLLGQSNVITRSIGSRPEVTPDISEVDIKPGDAFVLCTDGLTRHVHDAEILAAVEVTRDPQRAAETLSRLALERGGKDNLTIMVMRPGMSRKRRRAHPGLAFALIRGVAVLILIAAVVWFAFATQEHGRRSGDAPGPLPAATPASLYLPESDQER